MGLFRRKGVRLTREQSLSAIPVRNTTLEVTRDDAGRVTVSLAWRRGRAASVLAALFLVPAAKRRRVVQLDEVGSFVFDLVDGRRPVKSIVDSVADRYKLSRKEAALAITTYLAQLARRGIVALFVPEAGQARDAPAPPPPVSARKRKRRR